MATKLTSAGRVPLTDEELADHNTRLAEYEASENDRAAAKIRSKRDSLLTESDWTQVADAPVDQTAWATYRQSLRDIPQQDGFPLNVSWPDKP